MVLCEAARTPGNLCVQFLDNLSEKEQKSLSIFAKSQDSLQKRGKMRKKVSKKVN